MIVNDSKMIVKKCQNKYACICGKSYKHDSGYYKHKKTCTFVEEKEENTNEKIIKNIANKVLIDKETAMIDDE